VSAHQRANALAISRPMRPPPMMPMLTDFMMKDG